MASRMPSISKTDTDCILRGIGVFPSKEAQTTIDAAVYLLEKGAKSIRGSEPITRVKQQYYAEPYLGTEPIELQFEQPLLVAAQTTFTIVLEQKNEMGPSRFISKGKALRKVDFADGSGELEVRFSQSKDSFNSTDVDEGAIPVLYFVSKSAVLSEWGKKAASLNCCSDRLVFQRGTIEDQTRKKWKCTGGGETLAIKVDKTCILEGIGILPGKGRTEASLTVTLPEKDVLALSILHESEADAKGDLSEMVLGRTKRQAHARTGSKAVDSIGGGGSKGSSLSGGIPSVAALMERGVSAGEEKDEVKGADEKEVDFPAVSASATARRTSHHTRSETAATDSITRITVASGSAVFTEEDKPKECRTLRLDDPVLLEAGYTYTLELTQTNETGALRLLCSRLRKEGQSVGY